MTQTSRYDALRAAALGNYGFEAVILPVTIHEASIVDAAKELLARKRVALVVERDAPPQTSLPPGFFSITAADWAHHTFPTEWLETDAVSARPEPLAPPSADSETRVRPMPPIEAETMEVAQRRLRGLTTEARRRIGAAGFADARLDAVATLEDEIAWASASASSFGLVLVILPAKPARPSTVAERVLIALRQFLERAVRSSDAIAQGTDSILIVVSEADQAQTELVETRVKRALAKALKAAGRDRSLARAYKQMTVGMSVYPNDGQTRETLLARATATAKPALARGSS